MARRIILFLLSLVFFAGGGIFALSELDLATATGDHHHVYAALFGGGLLGLAGALLLLLTFRKRKPGDPGAAATGILVVGMTTAIDGDCGDGD